MLLFFFAFDNDSAFSYEGGNCPDRREHRREDCTNNTYRNREFNQGFLVFILDDNPANVTFFNYLFNLG